MSHSEELSVFKPDGFIVNKMTEFKLGYIAGYVQAKSELFIGYPVVTKDLVDHLKKEKAISQSFSDSKLLEIIMKISVENYHKHTYEALAKVIN